jgi:hypothetical protein
MDKYVAVVHPALAENDVRAEGKIANAVMRKDSSSLKETCLSRRARGCRAVLGVDCYTYADPRKGPQECCN